MKIAICFFGITRNFSKYTLDSIERYLFAEVARHDPKFRRFAHFNELAEVSNKRSRENSVPVDPEEFKLLNCDAVERTKQEEVDQQIDFDYIKQFGDNWRDDYGSLKNLLRQFYSLNAVTELLLAHGQAQPFDLVIFSRVDVRYETPVEIPRIRPGTLYTPWFDKYHGLNDRFALGDFKTMITYGRRQSGIRQFCEETGKPLGAESYLRWYAKKQGLHTRDLKSINFSRVRAHGVVSPIDSTAKAKMKYQFKHGLELIGLRRS
jgi:hypothetical protein